MKLGFSQQEIISTAKSLGLPSDGFIQRRVARAFDLVESNKVSQIDDGIFRVRSQYDEGKSYIVNVNSGDPSCDCPDGERTINCKHRIASLLYANRRVSNADDNRKQSQAITIFKTTDGNDGDFWRRCWCIAQGNRRTVVYEEHNGRLFCNCGAYYQDCKHKQLVIKTVTNELKSIAKEKRIVNECGTEQAKQLQDKMNGQLNSRNGNGNGAHKAPSQPMKLDLRDPFQESEQNDIDQIEGRKNGELAWKLSNGKYCISYKGIMTLSEKHGVTFTHGDNSNTKQVIARARLNGNERLSGKLPIPCQETAIELAKRNAARQLLPLEEIKALEYKTKLNAEFSWQKAYKKCAALVGTEANVDIIIHELVQSGKLRQDSPTHYDRTEWLIIHKACQEDAQEQINDGGDKTPSSPVVMVGDKPTSQDDLSAVPAQADGSNWREQYNKCVKVSSLWDTGIVINQIVPKHYYRKDRITDEEWQRVFSECKRRREEYERTQAAKADFASAQQAYKFKHIRDISGYDVKSKKYVGRPPLNSKEFLDKCKEAIAQVRAEKNTVEANDMPLESGNVKRQLQMDKKLRTWLIESDGTKNQISCREICEQFNDGSLVTRLRACIDDGADIGIVELD
jgi:hypothetical protein